MVAPYLDMRVFSDHPVCGQQLERKSSKWKDEHAEKETRQRQTQAEQGNKHVFTLDETHTTSHAGPTPPHRLLLWPLKHT